MTLFSNQVLAANETHQQEARPPEPWLRGTLTDVPPIHRAVLHALMLAQEDVTRWGATLSDEEVNAQPFGLTPFAFHVRHIAHSLDRLLTYAEGEQLNMIQRAALSVELEPGIAHGALFAEFQFAISDAERRIRELPQTFDEPRTVGTKKLPTTLGGLLVHLADHTQRHAGQAVITARLLLALREKAQL